MSSKHNKDILKGIARGPYAMEWAERQEERGRSFSGVDIYEAAPNTSAKAKKWGSGLADKIVLLNAKKFQDPSMSLEKMFEMAVAEGFAKDREAFGFYLGMQAIGHGVAWDDDISGSSIEFELPYAEYY